MATSSYGEDILVHRIYSERLKKTYYSLHLLLIGYFRLAGFQDGLKDKITNHKQMNRITNKISSLRYN